MWEHKELAFFARFVVTEDVSLHQKHADVPLSSPGGANRFQGPQNPCTSSANREKPLVKNGPCVK